MVKSALIFWFDLLVEARAEILEKFRCFFVQTMAPKRHFEINWPLTGVSAQNQETWHCAICCCTHMCAVSIQDTKKVGGDMYTQMSCFCPQKSFHQGWYKKYLTGCLEAPWCGASGQASVHSNLYLWIKEEEFLAVYTTQ